MKSSLFLLAKAFAFCLMGLTTTNAILAGDLTKQLSPFFARYCVDCHGDGADEGGLTLDTLEDELLDPATFQMWERILDRVQVGEMPPENSGTVPPQHVATFVRLLSSELHTAHATNKGTVLRRLNRREYQNTMNDLFGTHLDLESMLPEDGQSHGFDNIGERLGLSMVHMQQYLQAVEAVLDAAAETTESRADAEIQSFTYDETKEAAKLIGSLLKKLDDGSVVYFTSGRYPSGISRPFTARKAGWHKIRVKGYAYQSKKPITFSLTAVGPKTGSKVVSLGYHQFQPNKPATIEVLVYMDEGSMIKIGPEGIYDQEYKLRRVTPDKYDGPGLAISRVEIEGPIVDEFPSRGHRLMFDQLDRRAKEPPKGAKGKSWYQPEFEIGLKDPNPSIRSNLHRIATAAFRRPTTEDEIEDFVALYESQVEQGATVETAYKTSIAAIFCCPKFLYLNEPEGFLDDHALASRLSYFLVRSTPDAALLDAARSKQLASNPKAMISHTRRLIQSSHFDRFIVDFLDGWLNLREIDFTSPDQKLFPEFDVFLKDSMLAETRAFVKELVSENLPVKNLVESDFAMLNHRLAEHYGIDGVKHSEIRRVDLPDGSVRGGLLGQGSILKVSANGTNTSPVVRGVWVTERILGKTPPPPPPGIPGVEPDIRGAVTLRELLDKHRDLDTCRGCHQMIDPPGFALESFDPIGGWRDRFRILGEGERIKRLAKGRKVNYRLGLNVDCSGNLPKGEIFSGERFANYLEFRDQLASCEEVLARAFATKLLTFATGREIGFSDRETVSAIVKASKQSGFGIRDLIEQVVLSEAFRKK